jgi:hypothetical protein
MFVFLPTIYFRMNKKKNKNKYHQKQTKFVSLKKYQDKGDIIDHTVILNCPSLVGQLQQSLRGLLKLMLSIKGHNQLKNLLI